MSLDQWKAELRWRVALGMGGATVIGAVLGMTLEWIGVLSTVLGAAAIVVRAFVARRTANARTDVAS